MNTFGAKLVIGSIFECAEKALIDSSNKQSNLENKVVLALAIRLTTEKRALEILNFPYGDGKNQTSELYKKVKESSYILTEKVKEIFEQVMIMTLFVQNNHRSNNFL